MAANINILKIAKNSKMKRFQWKWIFTGSKICCTILQILSVCYGGHFESKMTAKIQKSPNWAKFGFQVDSDVAN
jgi:putative Ca2+/H+ antiporter (TMEM165/GDT1 family)